jgi:uncharacterized integral membrane protein (TIGR00698 family)
MKEFLKQFKSEDWLSTIMGATLLTLVICFPQFKQLSKISQEIIKLLLIGGLSAIGLKVLGNRIRMFALGFIFIFAIAYLSQYISSISGIKKIGLESVFFSVAIGLIIRNFIGLPRWVEPAAKSEFYIKAGLVILGSSILFGEIVKAGAYGMIQALIVVISVWYFTFWLAKKLGVDQEMGIMLSSAVSICGVSAAIATCGAIKGDNKKLSFVISIVLVVAIPMMYIMPFLSQLMGLSQEVAGAWLGGTIDTTGAVVASGKFLGEIAESQSVIIKSAQNVLLGVAAFAISIYWSIKGTKNDIRPSASVLWERFPKFVLGFIIASIVFSFLLDIETAKVLSKSAKGIRETLFAIAFVSIGLETDFKKVFGKENRLYTLTFLIAQLFNIVITLIVAFLLFGNYTFDFGF